MSGLRIVIPQNQGTVRSLLKEAGWEPNFAHGHPDENGKLGQTLNYGKISGNGDSIIQIRSMDALRLVASGQYDAGLVGSDCIEEMNWPVERLATFAFGRLWGFQPPRLEIVASANSKINGFKDVKPGSIVFSERPRLTSKFLQDKGLQVEIERDDEDPSLFRERLRPEGKVGIRIILGSAPVQLENGDLGVMVNESGKTVKDYGLRVIDKIMEIETTLIASKRAFDVPDKRDRIFEFQTALEKAYRLVENEFQNLDAEMGDSLPGEAQEKPIGRKF